MLALFKNVLEKIKIKRQNIVIDNWVFQLHYKVIYWFLLTSAAIVWANEYIGKDIECTHGDGTDDKSDRLTHIATPYCFYMSLFVVPRHYRNEYAAQPGVGAYNGEKGEVRHLNWYPWVPYVLVIQAFCFYIPHFLWKMMEYKQISRFAEGLIITELRTENERNLIQQATYDTIRNRIRLYTDWPIKMMFFEVLNFVHIFVQFSITDKFLGGYFWKLGNNFWSDIGSNKIPYLDIIFPKVAKCTFPKYGNTGSIMWQDLICVLSYNVINEKIYLLLWHLYLIVAILSGGVLVHRLLSFFLYGTRWQYNTDIMKREVLHGRSAQYIKKVISILSYREWFFLDYLIRNLEGVYGSAIIMSLANNNVYDDEEYIPRVTLPFSLQDVLPKKKYTRISEGEDRSSDESRSTSPDGYDSTFAKIPPETLNHFNFTK